jgi:hypothetical protein
MIDDVIIKQKSNGNIIIRIPHLKNIIVGDLSYKNNTYNTSFIYRQNELLQYLIDNNFIIVLNQEILNTNYNKYTFQLTFKSILRVL